MAANDIVKNFNKKYSVGKGTKSNDIISGFESKYSVAKKASEEAAGGLENLNLEQLKTLGYGEDAYKQLQVNKLTSENKALIEKYKKEAQKDQSGILARLASAEIQGGKNLATAITSALDEFSRMGQRGLSLATGQEYVERPGIGDISAVKSTLQTKETETVKSGSKFGANVFPYIATGGAGALAGVGKVAANIIPDALMGQLFFDGSQIIPKDTKITEGQSIKIGNTEIKGSKQLDKTLAFLSTRGGQAVGDVLFGTIAGLTGIKIDNKNLANKEAIDSVIRTIGTSKINENKVLTSALSEIQKSTTTQEFNSIVRAIRSSDKSIDDVVKLADTIPKTTKAVDTVTEMPQTVPKTPTTVDTINQVVPTNRIPEQNINNFLTSPDKVDAQTAKTSIDQLIEIGKTDNSKVTTLLNRKLGKYNPGKLVESMEKVVNDFGDAGKEISSRNRVQSYLKEKYKGEVESLFSSARKQYGKNYKATLNNAISKIKAAKTPELRANLTGLAKQIVEIQDARRATMVSNGIDVGFREGYFTDMIKPGMKDEASKYIQDKITSDIQVAIKNNDTATLDKFGLSINSSYQDIKDVALKEANGSITSYNVVRNLKNQIKSGVEYSKNYVLPPKFYETDPEIILASWGNDTAQRLASTQVFGKDDEVLDTMLNRIKSEYGDSAANIAMNMIERSRLGAKSSENKNIRQAAETIRSYNMFSRMGLSTITNAGQMVNKNTMFGGIKTATAYGKVLRNWSKYTEEASKRGIGLTDITDDLMETVYSGNKKNFMKQLASWELSINQFKNVEKLHRLADIALADDLISGIKKNGLDSKFTKNWARRLSLNYDSLKETGLTDGVKDLITRNVVKEIDFFVDPADLPSWVTSGEAGKFISQFAKFGMKQGGLVSKQIVREAKNGNFAPLLRWFVGAQVIGTGVTAAKGLVTGKERENSISDAVDSMGRTLERLESGDVSGAVKESSEARQFAWDNMMRTGGLGYAYDLFNNLGYGKTATDKILGALGPTTSSAKNILDAVDAWKDGDKEKAYRELANVLPLGNIVGPNIDRVTGGNTFTFDPKGGQVYELSDKLPETDKLSVSRDDADAFGKAVGTGDASNTAVVEQIARKLYDKNGNEKLLSQKTKDLLNEFLSDNGVENVKDIAVNSYKESATSSKELSSAKKKLSSSLKSIINQYPTSSGAEEYLDSIGESLDDYPALKDYYEMKGK